MDVQRQTTTDKHHHAWYFDGGSHQLDAQDGSGVGGVHGRDGSCAISGFHATCSTRGVTRRGSRGFRDELVGLLTEILARLKEQLQDTTTGTVGVTNRQLRKESEIWRP
eukprot:3740088-Rhodomonas_salina.1